MRGTRRQRIKLQRMFNLVVGVAYRDRGQCRGLRRVTITIINGPGQRGADPDAYAKAVGDALVTCGALRNDSRFWVEWMPTRYERGAREGSRIRLEDIEPSGIGF
jgi:hypothetical protein